MCTGSHPFISAANTINAQIIYDINEQKVENVYNIKSGSGVTEADMDRIQAKLYTWLNTYWKVQATTNASCALMVLRDASADDSYGKEYAVSPAVAGTNGSTQLPSNNTVTIKWTTGIAGRSYRGRTYHVGLAGSAISGNRLTVAYQTALVNCYSALRTGLLAGGTADVLSVVSYCHNGAWRIGSAAVTPISGCSVDINLDSQRRRLNNRGT